MAREIEMYLTDITYSGDSVGSDLTFSLNIDGKLITIKPGITFSATAGINRLLYKSSVTEDAAISVSVDIVEEDPVFSDFGSGTIVMPVKLNGANEQNYSGQVKVHGDSIGDKNKVASFLLNFKIVLGDDIRMVSSVSPGGWLDILHEDELTHPATLPYGLKVKVTKVEQGREYFTILEGRLAGHKASVKLTNVENQGSHLASEIVHKPPVNIVFSKSAKTLKLSDNGKKYVAFTDEGPILENGLYKVEIPYEKHTIYGSPYLHISKLAITWFRIRTPGKYFFHFGTVSEGCVTIDAEKNPIGTWEEIYRQLILARDPEDSNCVGYIKITD